MNNTAHEALIEVYTMALEIARDGKQVVGENSDYFITLEQLNYILMKVRDEKI